MLQKTQQTKNTSQQYENWTTTRYSASRLVYYNTYYNNTGVRTCNLFQVKKKKKKKVLFVAPGNQARVNVHRKRLRKGAPVMHDHNGKMYKGTVVEKEGDGQVLIAYPDFPGQYQEYKGGDTELYVKCT